MPEISKEGITPGGQMNPVGCDRIDAFTAGCLSEYRVRRDKMSRIRECQIVDDLAFFFDIRMPGGVFLYRKRNGSSNRMVEVYWHKRSSTSR